MGPGDEELAARFQEARGRVGCVTLQGFHALKHALRFGADVQAVLTSDPEGLERLSSELAPDLEARIRELAVAVSEPTYRTLGAYAHHTRVTAIARRPPFDPRRAGGVQDAPIVLLEDPRHLGNLGAVVRAAAAADAAAVFTTGEQDPWDPTAIRGSGGLHFALPVGCIGELESGDRPVFAFDPAGTPIDPTSLPANAVYAFGSERHGLSAELTSRADALLSIPMRPGVSSLNLATSVAIVLFAWRLSRSCAAR